MFVGPHASMKSDLLKNYAPVQCFGFGINMRQRKPTGLLKSKYVIKKTMVEHGSY